MKKWVISLFILLFFINNILAQEETTIKETRNPVYISNYPNFFLNKEVFVIIGENNFDLVSASYILNSLQNNNVQSVLKKANEISDITQQDLVIVGNACNNVLTFDLLGKPENCIEAVPDGQGLLKIYEHNNGKISFLVAGRNDADTNALANLLLNWQGQRSGRFEIVDDKTFYVIMNELIIGPQLIQQPQFIEPQRESSIIPPVFQKPEIIQPLQAQFPETVKECEGCYLENKCAPYGTRILQENILQENKALYCNLNKNFESQKLDEEFCQNNYECLSNQCTNGKCLNIEERLKETERKVEETKGLVSKIVEWLKRVFSIEVS